MHARRYFVKALEAGDRRAALAVDAFRALYDVEDGSRQATTSERLARRREKSRPVYDKLREWARLQRGAEPPASLLAKAIGYLGNHEVALTRVLDDGDLPIDNGIVERLHRDVAILRKNCLFAGSYEGGRRAAIALSVLASCEVLGINPMTYVASVLPELARTTASELQLRSLLPSSWKATNAPRLAAPSETPAEG